MNENCQYRNICGHAGGCYKHTSNEEEWCPYAKHLAEEGVRLTLEHWRRELAIPRGGLLASLEED
jgi:hypothetical protein